jgi:hypothetical protein
MCHADPGDVVRTDPGMDHLALGALPRVEQQAMPVPAQQVAIVIAGTGGNRTGGTEHKEIAYGHVPMIA